MRTIRLVPIVLVLGLLWASPTAGAQEPAPVEQLLALVNADRAAAGSPALSFRDDLLDIAGDWSVSMAASGTLAHNDAYFSPEMRQRIGPGARAENVAYAGDLAAVHRVLMDSPPHRANLLDARSTVVGIGAVFDGTVWWVTQDFLAAAPAPVPAPPAPDPATDTSVPPAVPEREDPPAPVASAPAPVEAVRVAPSAPVPATEVVPTSAEVPLSITLDLEPVPVVETPTSVIAAEESAVAPAPGAASSRASGIPGVGWVALVALVGAATATTRASRAARA